MRRIALAAAMSASVLAMSASAGFAGFTSDSGRRAAPAGVLMAQASTSGEQPATPATAPGAAIKLPELPSGAMDIATQPPTLQAPEPVVTAPAEPVVTTPELPSGAMDIATQPPTLPAADQTMNDNSATMAAPSAEPMEAKPADDAMAVTDGMKKETGAGSQVVVAGDNLWNLAKKFYGDGRMWTRIRDANPDARPQALKIGMTLSIPAAN